MVLLVTCLPVVHGGRKTGAIESLQDQTGNHRHFEENVNVNILQILPKFVKFLETCYRENCSTCKVQRVIKAQLSWGGGGGGGGTKKQKNGS